MLATWLKFCQNFLDLPNWKTAIILKKYLINEHDGWTFKIIKQTRWEKCEHGGKKIKT